MSWYWAPNRSLISTTPLYDSHILQGRDDVTIGVTKIKFGYNEHHKTGQSGSTQPLQNIHKQKPYMSDMVQVKK